MQGIRIIALPYCKMVASGTGMFGEGKLERFDSWFSTFPVDTYPRDYLYSTEGGFCWLYRWSEGMQVPAEFEIVDFCGGLYAVATDKDGQTDFAALNKEVQLFLEEHGLEGDPTRPWLGNVITPECAKKVLGYCQMDYYIPVREKQ